MITELRARASEPGTQRSFHGWATVFWTVMAPVAMFTSLKHSIMFLVGISVYTAVMGHWSSWQTARVEVKITES